MNPEGNKNTADLTKPKNTLGNVFSSALFYLSILLFIIGFNFSDVMVGNWYQQFMPNIGGRNIADITFTDSLNGYILTTRVNDTSFILSTTNMGNTWFLNRADSGAIFNRVQFLNQSTGFVGGYIKVGPSYYILKTTNSGLNWTYINAPFQQFANDMAVVSEDTILLVNSEGAFGGVFRTTNGGASWTQVNLAPNNPDRIYMYNARIGFVSRTSSPQLRKTTDGGQTWNVVNGTGTGSFNDLYFTDSLTGWKAKSVGGGGWLMGKTIDGGFNWAEQILPFGGNISNGSGISQFVNINKDTIWGVGGNLFYPGQGARAFLYRTTNSGDTWYFQIPDTSYQIPTLSFIDFKDKIKGWAYMVGIRGIHTTNGGDTTFYLPVTQISTEVPEEYILGQNYPNPFNPETNIKYQIMPNDKSDFGGKMSNVKLIIFDITGKEIVKLVNEEQSAGTYLAVWNASGYSSGVYFYSLVIGGITIDTKKMILLK